MVKITLSYVIRMNFIVTGGAGFIGSHLVHHLVSERHSVTVIDDLSRGSLANLNDIRNKIHIKKIDICEQEHLDNIIQDADGIFHQAALVSVPESWKSPDTYQKVNVDGTENIFKIATKLDIKVVYASSASVYGDCKTIPIREDSERKPLNPYGKTKLDCETIAKRYVKMGAQIIGLRYFNVFGAGQNSNYAGVITHFLNRLNADKLPIIFGDGSQIRDFVFVGDVVQANLAAMSSNVTDGFFNIGGGIPTTLTDLAHAMIRLSCTQMIEPKYEPTRHGDAKISIADISKAANQLGWRPKTTLEDGLQTLLQDSVNRSL